MSETEPVARKSPASGGSTAGPVGAGTGWNPALTDRLDRLRPLRRGASHIPHAVFATSRTKFRLSMDLPTVRNGAGRPSYGVSSSANAEAAAENHRSGRLPLGHADFWVRPTNREPCDSAKRRAIVEDRRCAMAVWR